MRGHGGRRASRAAALLVAAALAGCSSGDDGTGSPDAPVPSSSPDATTALRERCLSAIPDEADVEALTLDGRTGGEVEAARIGPAASDTVAVLLPQTSGLCGWGRWAAAAADEAGVTSLVVNPCGYGGSTCPADADADPLNEVGPALALARDDLGASRVVLLGTSMGGSLTVMAVAAGADVDAWADVSGPPAWEGTDLATLAPRLAADGVPEGLVVMAPSDGPAIFAAARDLARAAGVRFLPGRAGHGWELLVDPVEGTVTRLGRRLITLAADTGGG